MPFFENTFNSFRAELTQVTISIELKKNRSLFGAGTRVGARPSSWLLSLPLPWPLPPFFCAKTRRGARRIALALPGISPWCPKCKAQRVIVQQVPCMTRNSTAISQRRLAIQQRTTTPHCFGRTAGVQRLSQRTVIRTTTKHPIRWAIFRCCAPRLLSSSPTPRCLEGTLVTKRADSGCICFAYGFLLRVVQGGPGCIPWGIVGTFLNDYLAQVCTHK